MNKKIMVLLTAFAFIFTIGGSALAQDLKLQTTNIGCIDVQKVFLSYKETKKAQDDLAQKEKKYKSDYDDRQEKLNKMKTDGKSQKEIDEATKKMEDELKPMRDEILALNEKLTVKLQGDIVKAVTEVAKGVGLDLVLDKQVIIIGGTDLTEMVINKLNK